MTQHPAPTRPTPQPAATAAPDLTLSKVLAGAGAAATAAVIGSLFGAEGTVVGAALGSIASTIASVIYQRSLDRTRETLVARFRPGAATSSEVTLPLPRRPTGDETVVLRPVPPRPRRRWVTWAAIPVGVFAIGMLVVTGLEWAKGSTLSTGQPGTSVGRVLTPSDGSSGGSGGNDGSPTTTSTPAPSSAPRSTTTTSPSSPTPRLERSSPTPSRPPAPSSVPGLGGLLGGGTATSPTG